MRPTVILWIEGRRSYRSVALRSYWTLGNTFNFWMGISSVGTPSVPIQIICYHVNRFQSITIPSDYNRINEDSTNKMIYYGLLVIFAGGRLLKWSASSRWPSSLYPQAKTGANDQRRTPLYKANRWEHSAF